MVNWLPKFFFCAIFLCLVSTTSFAQFQIYLKVSNDSSVVTCREALVYISFDTDGFHLDTAHGKLDLKVIEQGNPARCQDPQGNWYTITEVSLGEGKLLEIKPDDKYRLTFTMSNWPLCL